jgi:hypothetical protein
LIIYSPPQPPRPSAESFSKGSLHIHVELLLRSPLLQVLHLVALVLQAGLPLRLLLLLALEVQLQVELGGVRFNVGFCLLEVVLEHPPHAVQLQGLVGVHLVLETLLLLTLTLLLDLLVQPLLLLVLEELLPGIVLYLRAALLRSSPSNSRQPESSLVCPSVGKSRKYVSLVRFIEVIKIL